MKIKMIIMSCVLIMSALFICTGKMNKVEAKGINESSVSSVVSDIKTDENKTNTLTRIEKNHINAEESSGVSELDAAKDRTDSLIEWICRWIGATIAVISLIVAAMMASSHQTEQRNTALVVMVLGIVIFFAPQIIDYLLGR